MHRTKTASIPEDKISDMSVVRVKKAEHTNDTKDDGKDVVDVNVGKARHSRGTTAEKGSRSRAGTSRIGDKGGHSAVEVAAAFELHRVTY
jgi:hypothetical protein